MDSIKAHVNMFWKWAGYREETDISRASFDPLSFPGFEDIKNICISRINKPLSAEEIDAFLLCMALDDEDECILDACKESANVTFLCALISKGISHPQSNARWQIAELLKREDIPNRQQYLSALLSDPHPYVRKRAFNVAFRSQ